MAESGVFLSFIIQLGCRKMSFDAADRQTNRRLWRLMLEVSATQTQTHFKAVVYVTPQTYVGVQEAAVEESFR